MSLIHFFHLQDRIEPDSELERRINVLLACYILTIAALAFMSLVAAFEGALHASIRDWTLIGFLLAGFLYFLRTLNYEVASVSGLVMVGAFLIMNQIYGMEEVEFMFFYAYPVVAAFLIGFRRGVLISVLLLLGSVAWMLYLFLNDENTFYQPDVISRFILSYLLVTLFSFILEYLRAMSQLQLEKTNKQLEALSLKDALTGVYNRRFFDMSMERETRSFKRRKRPFCIIMIDVDHFKSHNDHYGHQMGDRSLIRIADALRKSASRATDSTCRYGGEEFVMILSETELKGALKVAEVISKNIKYLGIENHPHGRLTVSMGIAQIGMDNLESTETIIRATDEALYKAKRDGRDRYVVYHQQEEKATS